MFFYSNFKKKVVIILSIFFLCSCGVIGGDDKNQVSENAVLSGPPLAIPPEFDIESSQNTITGQDDTNYDIPEYNDLENNTLNDEVIYEDDQLNQMSNVNNDIENQNFENLNTFNENNVSRQFENLNTFNENNVSRQIDTNVRKKRISRKPSVPSDSYNFNTTVLSEKNIYVKNKSNSFTGFGKQDVEIKNSKDLSNEEELLLNDILNQSSDLSNETLDQDFEAKGDSD